MFGMFDKYESLINEAKEAIKKLNLLENKVSLMEKEINDTLKTLEKKISKLETKDINDNSKS